MKNLLILIAALVLVLASCSTPAAPEYNSRPSYNSELSSGWDLFSDGSYSLAAIQFRDAIDLDSQRQWPDAYIGLGWSLAMQDSVTKAISYFTSALSKTPDNGQDSADIYTGLGLGYRDISPANFTLVRSNVQSALAIDSLYVFQHLTTINSDDLYAVLAEAFFNLEYYDSAAALVDPAGTLDPESEDYLTSLLTKINTQLLLSGEGG